MYSTNIIFTILYVCLAPLLCLCCIKCFCNRTTFRLKTRTDADRQISQSRSGRDQRTPSGKTSSDYSWPVRHATSARPPCNSSGGRRQRIRHQCVHHHDADDGHDDAATWRWPFCRCRFQCSVAIGQPSAVATGQQLC